MIEGGGYGGKRSWASDTTGREVTRVAWQTAMTPSLIVERVDPCDHRDLTPPTLLRVA